MVSAADYRLCRRGFDSRPAHFLAAMETRRLMYSKSADGSAIERTLHKHMFPGSISGWPGNPCDRFFCLRTAVFPHLCYAHSETLVSTLDSTPAPIGLTNFKDPINSLTFKRRRRLGFAKTPFRESAKNSPFQGKSPS